MPSEPEQKNKAPGAEQPVGNDTVDTPQTEAAAPEPENNTENKPVEKTGLLPDAVPKQEGTQRKAKTAPAKKAAHKQNGKAPKQAKAKDKPKAKTKQPRPNNAVDKLARRAGRTSPGRVIGQGLYMLGFYAECKLVQIWRVLRIALGILGQVAVWVFGGFAAAVASLARGIARDIAAPFQRRAPRVALAGAGAGGGATTVPQGRPARPRGIKPYLQVLLNLGKLCLPLVAAAVFAFVVYSLLNLQYNLRVEVNGEVVGYVSDELTVADAQAMLRQRIVAAEDKSAEEWSISVTYTLAGTNSLTTKQQLVNNILLSYDPDEEDALVEATGLYVGDELLVTTEGEQLAAFLEEMLHAYDAPENDASPYFDKTVEIDPYSNDVFFSSSVKSLEDIKEILTSTVRHPVYYTATGEETLSEIAFKHNLSVATLMSYNPEYDPEATEEEEAEEEEEGALPIMGAEVDGDIAPSAGTQFVVLPSESFLPVVTTRIEYRLEIVPYTTETVYNDNRTIRTSKILQEGVDGLYNVPYEIRTVDGAETVLQANDVESIAMETMVPEIVEVGTFVPVWEGGEINEDAYVFPVPGYTYSSRGFGGAHRGVDINANYGTPIFASRGGTVADASYHSSYGYNVLIDHGDGVTTRYAHCSELLVEVGDVVGQTDLIALVGSTGDSSGNHCHFEIRVNGSFVDPIRDGYIAFPER